MILLQLRLAQHQTYSLKFNFIIDLNLTTYEKKSQLLLAHKARCQFSQVTSNCENCDYSFLWIDASFLFTCAENSSGNDLSGSVVDQQQIKVSGTVTNALTGETLTGVNVVVTGTNVGTITDIEGKYSIEVPPGSKSLTFSFIGMDTQEVAIGTSTQINVTMVETAFGLNEVVVIGYGTMKKSDLTGSVSSVPPEKLVNRPIINVGEALQNRVAGVQVIRQAAGDPGGRPQIRIRGTNSINTSSDPLFVVDGVVGVMNALQNLDPKDIATMDVLKDASSTAIYGTRGANGVIMITTKRGVAGEVRVDYDGSVSVGIKTRRNDAVNADQFMYLYEQAFNNTPKYGNLVSTKDFRGPNAAGLSWNDMPYLFEEVAKDSYLPGLNFIGNDGKYYKPRFNTLLEDEVFRNALSYKNRVEVSGGTEKGRYSLAIGNNHMESLLKESYNNRLNLRATMDVKLAKWLDLSANVAYAKSKRDRMSSDLMRNTSEFFAIFPPYRYPNDPEIYGSYAGTFATGRDFNVGENRPGSTFMLNQDEGITNLNTGAFELTAQITPD